MKCGKKTEVYSRVTGYYSPLHRWNKGKREEQKDRVMFNVEVVVHETHQKNRQKR